MDRAASTPDSHRTPQVPSRGVGGTWGAWPTAEGGGPTALPEGLQSATVLSCSLNLPRGLGVATIIPSVQMGKRRLWTSSSRLAPPRLYPPVSVPRLGEHWMGRSVAGWAHHSAVWHPLGPEAAEGKY